MLTWAALPHDTITCSDSMQAECRTSNDCTTQTIHAKWGILLTAPPVPLHPLSSAVQDGLLSNQSPASVRAVLAPKVGGASALLAAMPHLPLQQLLLFSSVASLVGAAGQANYVSANATLDCWAAAARCCGCAASSIQWGAWASAGELVSPTACCCDVHAVLWQCWCMQPT